MLRNVPGLGVDSAAIRETCQMTSCMNSCLQRQPPVRACTSTRCSSRLVLIDLRRPGLRVEGGLQRVLQGAETCNSALRLLRTTRFGRSRRLCRGVMPTSEVSSGLRLHHDSSVHPASYFQAFAKTSLSYDRYLKAGDLYSGAAGRLFNPGVRCSRHHQRHVCLVVAVPAGYDPVTSTTIFFQNVSDSQLQYTPLALSLPQIRDEVPRFRASGDSWRILVLAPVCSVWVSGPE